MKKIKVTLHWSFVLLGLLMLIFGKFTSFVCCMISVFLHEMGHAFVGRKLGYQLNLITLLPYGAMLSGKNTPFKTGDDIKIAVAGPVVNILLLLLSFLLWLIFPAMHNLLGEFIWANIYTFCFNVLPVYPLDGGRVLVALLTRKMPRIKALKITKIIGYVVIAIIFVLFFVSFFFNLNYMLGINALFLLIGLFAEDTSPYYEKMAYLQNTNHALHFLKSIKLDKNTPVFVAYKQIANKNISNIKLTDNNKVIKVLSCKKIMDGILNQPIDTTLENLK